MLINYLVPDLSLLFRGVAAVATSLILTIVLGKPFIGVVKKYVQPIRIDGPETHLIKKDTATFGGILIILVFLISLLLWCNFNRFVLIVLFGGLSFATIGLIDDTLKLMNKSSKGLSGKIRLAVGLVIGLIIAFLLTKAYPADIVSKIYWPFVFSFYIPTFGLFVLWVPLIITGSANAVNLTDGLDSLASITVATVAIVFVIIAGSIYSPYWYNSFMGNYAYLKVPLGELFVVALAFVGALLGFLWYNSHPAKLFMGDVGSLFLGGTLGSLAITLKHEVILGVAGIIFVLEALSVIIQVYYYKLTKKRVFLMAPLHHHFEKKGLTETTIVSRFWIVTIIMSMVALLLIFI